LLIILLAPKLGDYGYFTYVQYEQAF